MAPSRPEVVLDKLGRFNDFSSSETRFPLLPPLRLGELPLQIGDLRVDLIVINFGLGAWFRYFFRLDRLRRRGGVAQTGSHVPRPAASILGCSTPSIITVIPNMGPASWRRTMSD